MTPKKVIFIVIDALASRVVLPAMETGRLPNLAALAEHGQRVDRSIAVFPSITPAATASLITGQYPASHGIAGAHWYDEQTEEVAYYGDDLWVILNKGLHEFIEDFVVRLNETRLRSKTLFELVEDMNRRAACLNFLWFRGRRRHELSLPFWLWLLGRTKKHYELSGPDILCLGDLAAAVDSSGEDLSIVGGGIWNRFGFNDEATAQYLLELARAQQLPDLTVAYFPDNDWKSHDVGPQQALTAVEKVDGYLGELFAVCGGLERLLRDTAVIVTGDHSQAEMVDSSADPAPGIALHELLSDFNLVEAGSDWEGDEAVMACPNMRAAQIYLRAASPSELSDRVQHALLTDRRIDQVICCNAAEGDSDLTWRVMTADRGELRFGEHVPHGQSAVDPYEATWSYSGNLAAIDSQVRGDRLLYGRYPNALERLANAFSDKAGSIWVTAQPGYEFKLPETSVHPGGSHGSLHELDSWSPMIAAGVPEGLIPSAPFRAVDCVPLCLELLGGSPSEKLGVSHQQKPFLVGN